MPPLHVRVAFEKGEGENLNPRYFSWVGLYGQLYNLDFNAMLRLIRVRQGHQQKRLEHRS